MRKLILALVLVTLALAVFTSLPNNQQPTNQQLADGQGDSPLVP